ncbi:sporulation protein YqfD [Paradesulfitobacterium aromaticivorans]
MVNKARSFIYGQVYFLAQGNDISGFINEAVRDKVVLFNAQRSERGLKARVKLEDFRKLRRAARTSHSRVRINAKYGLPFILRRWWRRKGLLAGLAIIVIAVSILSQMVLSITVSGNKNLSADTVIKQAETLGLKKWVWHKNLDLNALSKVLQEQTPDAAWIGIERTGTHVEINIVEKIRPVVPSQAGNLIAAKAGLIREIMVIQGVPQVHEGETVRAGQVLIVQGPIPAGPGIPASAQNSAAKGFVRGRVWYTAEGKVPLVESKVEESGQTAIGWGIKFGSRVIMVTTPQSPYAQADKEVGSRPVLAWRNWRFPVELISVKYKELVQNNYERAALEARQEAEEHARAEVYAKITPGAKVVEEAVKVLPAGSGVERVRIEVETYEDLAVYTNP